MASEAVTLRLARSTDARDMARMCRDYVEAGLAPRYTAPRMERLIRDRDTIALVADDGRGVQGFALMHFGEEKAHLVLLCVRPEQRRAGIGRCLLEWLLASARVAGIASVHLELRADNAQAYLFYKRLGFSETVQIPGYYEGHIAARRMLRLLRGPA